MTIFSIIFAILLFAIIIILHELGHFVAAKLSGVQVNEFALFMGPAIFKKQIGETLYSIRCIPFGGYCAMEGEDEDTDNPRSFQKAAWWKRLIILVSGSFMNLITGFLLFALVFSFAKSFENTKIDFVEEGCTVVREDGLQFGDLIIDTAGSRIYTSTDALLLFSFDTPTHDIVVKRDGEKIVFDDYLMEKHPFLNEKTGEYEDRYGFNFGADPASIGRLLPSTWAQTCSTIQNVRISLNMLLTGKAGLKDMAGPVLIVSMMSTTATAAPKFIDAVVSMLYFGGFIAVNLAVMNMLPIPAIDGGRSVGLLLTTAIEKITKKKLNPKYEGYVHAVGLVLLFVLMIVILFKDVFQLIKG